MTYITQSKIIKVEDLDSEALIEAINVFRKLNCNESSQWIQDCKDRLTDVEFMGTNDKGGLQFQINHNPKYDSYRGTYRKVVLRLGSTFCNCMFGQEKYRFRKLHCKHIGTCQLFDMYFKILYRRKQEEEINFRGVSLKLG